MSVMSPEKRAELEAKKAQLEAQLVLANSSLDSLLDQRNKSYKFDSNEGSQAEVFRSLEDQWKIIEHLERHLDFVCRRLEGKVNFNLNVRRKLGYRRGRYLGN